MNAPPAGSPARVSYCSFRHSAPAAILIMHRTNLFQQFSPAAGREGCLTPVAQAHEFVDIGSDAVPLSEGGG